MDDATILSVRIVALQSAVAVVGKRDYETAVDTVLEIARAFEDHLLGNR